MLLTVVKSLSSALEVEKTLSVVGDAISHDTESSGDDDDGDNIGIPHGSGSTSKRLPVVDL